jgi:hypothetical protein
MLGIYGSRGHLCDPAILCIEHPSRSEALSIPLCKPAGIGCDRNHQKLPSSWTAIIVYEVIEMPSKFGAGQPHIAMRKNCEMDSAGMLGMYRRSVVIGAVVTA